MVEVEVGLDHHVDVLRRDAERAEAAEQALAELEAVYAVLLLAVVVAEAGLDEECSGRAAHQQAVGGHRYAVALVRLDQPAPERLWHDAEHGAAVEPEDAVVDDVKPIGSDFHTGLRELVPHAGS